MVLFYVLYWEWGERVQVMIAYYKRVFFSRIKKKKQKLAIRESNSALPNIIWYCDLPFSNHSPFSLLFLLLSWQNIEHIKRFSCRIRHYPILNGKRIHAHTHTSDALFTAPRHNPATLSTYVSVTPFIWLFHSTRIWLNHLLNLFKIDFSPAQRGKGRCLSCSFSFSRNHCIYRLFLINARTYTRRHSTIASFSNHSLILNQIN